ncbi:glycoside hydrolase family 28 protein [Roseimarinus sediminis]|uniref:glycoside hydrolase family 28 protein n=1 Tax=Roseimarinus sediminis TaxID=1610899 RepID=UPI003D2217B0
MIKKRKDMLKVLTLFVAVFLFAVACNSGKAEIAGDQWERLDTVLSQIVEPEFAEAVYVITDYGAIADGKSNNTEAINNAVRACHENGGGKVLVPEGTFYTGPVHLLSNVNLHLHEKATLLFSVDPADYLPLVYTRWEGIDCYNYSPLIYARNQQNIAVTGKGKLQGNASEDDWWIWKGRKEYGWKEGDPSQLLPHARPALKEYNAKGIPAEERRMGEGFYLRPQFINFIECKNVLIEELTIENAPFWVIHPVFCENLIVRGVTINSLGPNNDGCDPESCKNVLIEDCYFNTGDDCIAIKSGRNRDGIVAARPSENIVVRNCFMKNGHGGVVIGSEISGGARNIFVENCKMDSPELDRAIRIKTNSNRSGIIENIYVRKIEIGEVKEAVLRINCNYDIKKEGTDTLYPVVRHVYLSEMSCTSSKYGLLLQGIEGQECIYDIHLDNSEFKGVKKGNSISHAQKVSLRNVTMNGEKIAYNEIGTSAGD